jgi:hypothetical protein
MITIINTLTAILAELKIINKQLQELTGKHYIAGRRYDL